MNISPALSFRPAMPARAAAAPPPADTPAPNKIDHPIEVGVGAADILWTAISQSGKADNLKSLTRARNQDEALGTLVASVSELALQGTGVKDLDKALEADYKGTVDKYVTNPSANRVLKGIGSIFGDHVASVMVSAALGDLATTVQDVRRDPKLKAQMSADPAAFGKAVLSRAGSNLPKDMASAFLTAKLQNVPVLGGLAAFLAPFVVRHTLGQ